MIKKIRKKVKSKDYPINVADLLIGLAFIMISSVIMLVMSVLFPELI